ncbi:ATP-binding protein [Sulfitobacter pacificus]|uniref:ATP-binding protein n=1 Tax=Sulfitobacter pacificus TaxID=1499314 RepID=UPI0036079A65
MNVGINQLIFVCLAYVVFLFAVAFLAERASAQGRFAAILRSPLIYTLSLSIYCTAWTFYGAVGYAARSGLEYVTIYLGPSLVMIGWWWILRRLVSIGRSQRVTSIADLISSRYGKSNALAIVVTLMAVIGVTPYIALQLQSVVLSLSIFATAEGAGGQGFNATPAAFWVATGLALFTVLFGTRNLNVNERHHGIVIAVAVEAVVKLVALLAVGIFVVWGLAGGLTETLARIDASDIGEWEVQGSRWTALTLLSAAAFLCLPRMFQVMVVENDDERHLQIASWAFPAYLMLMSLFVVPIAVVGLDLLPAGSNPDLFVLSLPLSQNQNGLATLSFLGVFLGHIDGHCRHAGAEHDGQQPHCDAGLAGAASGRGDAIGGCARRDHPVAAVLYPVNHRARVSLLPCIRRQRGFGGDRDDQLWRCGAVFACASGGIFWRGATRAGALCGLGTGFALWIFTMLLPSFGMDVALSKDTFEHGLMGLSWLRPQALFGIEGLDPTVHAVVWSLSLNTLAFTLVSIFSFPEPIERLQGAQFVNVSDHAGPSRVWTASVAGSEDLMIMSQRIMGASEAQIFFQKQTEAQGLSGHLPEPTPAFIEALERELAASVGAATAHAMVSQIVGGSAISVQDLLAVADESAQMLEYSSQLEQKSRQLSETAAKLQAANEKLTQLSLQKDGFLSQISHELRTPMTSIRSFSEILRDTGSLSEADKTRYASIIHAETIRLTRLLDDLLDLSVLENGQVSLHLAQEPLHLVLERAVTTVVSGGEGGLQVQITPQAKNVVLNTDLDRLVQVFINLISNAQKYCQAETPKLTITPCLTPTGLTIDFIDNGTGIAVDERVVIFEKFYRVGGSQGDGAGLGLAICQEIMERLGERSAISKVRRGRRFRYHCPIAHWWWKRRLRPDFSVLPKGSGNT